MESCIASGDAMFYGYIGLSVIHRPQSKHCPGGEQSFFVNIVEGNEFPGLRKSIAQGTKQK